MFDFGPYNDYGPIDIPVVKPDLKSGEGHGHYRDGNRERNEKNAYKRKHKRIKQSKTSRRRNRC